VREVLASRLHRVHRWKIDWKDDSDVLALGNGVQVKVFRQDTEGRETDLLVKFPPGYVEPVHTHDRSHSIHRPRGSPDRRRRAHASR